jgi:hypothetical protein
MTTKDLIVEFVNGATKGKASGGRLYIEGNKLINYGTCLAEVVNGTWYVNVTKYSRTTTTHQNYLNRYLNECGIAPILLDDVPMGCTEISTASQGFYIS